MSTVLSKAYAAVVVLAVITSAIGFHVWKVGSLESALSECQGKYKTLSDATDIQSAEVKRLKSLGDFIAANLKDAEATNKLLRVEVDALKGKINRPVPATCDGQLQYILENVTEANKLWKK